MDVVGEILSVATVVLGLIAAAYFSLKYRDTALWITWAAILAAITSGFAFFQDRLWKADASTSSPSGFNIKISPAVGIAWTYGSGADDSASFQFNPTITNASDQPASVGLRLGVTYKLDDGELNTFWSDADFNGPFGIGIPKTFLNLAPKSSERVSIEFSGLSATQAGIATWETKQIYEDIFLELEVVDFVTGDRVKFDEWDFSSAPRR